MAGDSSAYAALGLEPGADLAAIEQAYRKLIKQHHPDREGGDARRAAELNHAYRELKAASAYRDPLELNHHMELGDGGARGWLIAALLLAIAVVALSMLDSPLGERLGASEGARPGAGQVKATRRSDAMEEPLNLAVIDRAIDEAKLIARTEDEFALAKASGECHRQLRSSPTVVQLDRCAAFDGAVIQLQNRDPLRDQGPFNELTVTGRLWSGASALSGDYLAIDGRLDRIRLRVELALAPRQEDVQPSAGETPEQRRPAAEG